jgi:hypothetical protein
LLPIAWSYNYGDPREPEVLRNAAPDSSILVVDPETEYESLPLSAQVKFNQALQALRSTGIEIGAACFARPEVHQGYHYGELGACIDFWLPMVAWPYWNPPDVGYWLGFWDSFNLGRTIPWLPTYSDDSGTPIEPSVFLGSVRTAMERYGGASIWAAHTITEEQVMALESAKQEWLTVPPPTPTVQAGPSMALVLGGFMIMTGFFLLYSVKGGQF